MSDNKQEKQSSIRGIAGAVDFQAGIIFSLIDFFPELM